jgi:hypothetical protein
VKLDDEIVDSQLCPDRAEGGDAELVQDFWPD